MQRSLLLFGLLAAPPALGWEHVGHVWADSTFPLVYQSNFDEVGGCAGLDAATCLDEVETAWHTWAQSCTPVAIQDGGALPAGTGFDFFDSVNSVVYGAGNEVGVLGSSLTISSGNAFMVDGQMLRWASTTDILISEGVDFVTHQEAVAGDCADQSNLRAVMVHEAGHSLGLGHSCEENEPCADAELRGAVMHWSSDSCDTVASPQPDDLAGFDLLYGPAISFSCGIPTGDFVMGNAPFTADCSASVATLGGEVEWWFGDGGIGEGTEVTHTWEAEGLYDVTVTAAGQEDTCGVWERTVVERGYVRVCDVPNVQFELGHIIGKTWSIHNQTDISVLGCTTEVLWSFYQGDKASGVPHSTFEEWEFDHEFPEEGEWTVVLNVGGPAGTGAASATFEVRRHSDTHPLGCMQVGPGSAVGGLWLLPALALRRRRSTLSV
jgi:hypothetical protein